MRAVYLLRRIAGPTIGRLAVRRLKEASRQRSEIMDNTVDRLHDKVELSIQNLDFIDQIPEMRVHLISNTEPIVVTVDH